MEIVLFDIFIWLRQGCISKMSYKSIGRALSHHLGSGATSAP